MLTEAKNQIKVSLLSIKYATMREMLNKWTFSMNVLFMILNNATFIIQWIILFSLKEDVGGYTLKQVLLLWGIASGTYGISHLFFEEAFNLSKLIVNGKLDSFMVQPKNVLISVITSRSKISALGDLIYGYIVLLFYGITLRNFIIYTFAIICGGLIVTEISVIYNSLCFWFVKADILGDTVNNTMLNFATYPDTIFKNSVKLLLYTLIPVGFSTYIPLRIVLKFGIIESFLLIFSVLFFGLIAFGIFNKGLKKYSSSNLMVSRI